MNKKLFLHNPMVIPWVLIIIAGIIYIYSKFSKFSKFNNFSKIQENFTPGLRSMYNPHIRNMRVYTTKTYNNVRNKAKVLLSRFGII
jgi:hypothetical protein